MWKSGLPFSRFTTVLASLPSHQAELAALIEFFILDFNLDNLSLNEAMNVLCWGGILDAKFWLLCALTVSLVDLFSKQRLFKNALLATIFLAESWLEFIITRELFRVLV